MANIFALFQLQTKLLVHSVNTSKRTISPIVPSAILHVFHFHLQFALKPQKALWVLHIPKALKHSAVRGRGNKPVMLFGKVSMANAQSFFLCQRLAFTTLRQHKTMLFRLVSSSENGMHIDSFRLGQHGPARLNMFFLRCVSKHHSSERAVHPEGDWDMRK